MHLYPTEYGPYYTGDNSRRRTPKAIIRNEQRIRMPALEVRLASLKTICKDLPAVLVGDFNSPSHLDDTTIEWPTTKLMEDTEFVDSYREEHPNVAAYPGLTWWAPRAYWLEQTGRTEPQHRIDYVFTRNTKILSSELVGERHNPAVDISVYPWYSDHRGVVTELLV
jgi:endonuclease/exonuclease/phosphatase family metal-dependent hydrolase